MEIWLDLSGGIFGWNEIGTNCKVPTIFTWTSFLGKNNRENAFSGTPALPLTSAMDSTTLMYVQ